MTTNSSEKSLKDIYDEEYYQPGEKSWLNEPDKDHLRALQSVAAHAIACDPVREMLAEALKLAHSTFSCKCEGQHKWPKREIEEALDAYKESLK